MKRPHSLPIHIKVVNKSDQSTCVTLFDIDSRIKNINPDCVEVISPCDHLSYTKLLGILEKKRININEIALKGFRGTHLSADFFQVNINGTQCSLINTFILEQDKDNEKIKFCSVKLTLESGVSIVVECEPKSSTDFYFYYTELK